MISVFPTRGLQLAMCRFGTVVRPSAPAGAKRGSSSPTWWRTALAEACPVSGCRVPSCLSHLTLPSHSCQKNSSPSQLPLDAPISPKRSSRPHFLQQAARKLKVETSIPPFPAALHLHFYISHIFCFVFVEPEPALCSIKCNE